MYLRPSWPPLGWPDAVIHPDGGLFGVFGGQLNLIDAEGRLVYMRGCADNSNAPLRQFTLFPTVMRGFFTQKQLSGWRQHAGFRFTKGMKLMDIEGRQTGKAVQATLLYDLHTDPEQLAPLGRDHTKLEHAMIQRMIRLMAANDAPDSQYARLGLPHPSRLSRATVAAAGMLGTARGERDRRGNGNGAVFLTAAHRKTWAANLERYGAGVMKSSL